MELDEVFEFTFRKRIFSVFSLLSDCMVRLVKKYPQLLMEHCAEIKEYIGSIRNIDDKEDFFVHMVRITHS